MFLECDNIVRHGFAHNIYRCVAQLGRALRSGRRGRRFESCRIDYKKTGTEGTRFFRHIQLCFFTKLHPHIHPYRISADNPCVFHPGILCLFLLGIHFPFFEKNVKFIEGIPAVEKLGSFGSRSNHNSSRKVGKQKVLRRGCLC